ncbi:MAG: hypothetical protein FJX77_11565, partial [Armatimonadetes bacterium]|nr:hypothetical protein [Armatimonadota bacterium]
IGDATRVVTEGEGFAGVVLGPDDQPLSSGDPRDARLVNNTEVRVRFHLAGGAEMGLREFRLYTPVGLSCKGAFLIGPEGPVTREEEPNDGQTLPLSVPGAADGRIQRSEDVDAYRFSARAGEGMAFYVQAQEAGSPLDSVLTVKDAAGKILVTNEDYMSRNAAVGFRAPAAGEYRLEIKDTETSGSEIHSYRILATRGPYIRTTYPLGAPADMLADLSLFGLNTGETGKTTDEYSVMFDAPQARVQIPAAPGTTTRVRVATPGGYTNPFPVQVLDVPDVREQEPNDEAAQAGVLAVPGVAHGRIYVSAANPKGDVDLWRFTAKKGEKLRLAITAMRQGSSLDATLTVRDRSGKKLAGADDGNGSRDPALEFTPPEEGEYLAEVVEVSGGGALDAVYMLRADPVRPPAPGFSLELYPANPSIPRGGAIPVEVKVTRIGGFSGPIRYQLPPLPAGVTALIPPEAATMDKFYVALRAASDAPYAVGDFSVTGVAEIGGKEVSHRAVGKERVWKNAPLRPVDTLLQHVAVCEPMDFTVELGQQVLELKPGETRDVTVIIKKIRGYIRGIPIRAATVDYGGGALPRGLTVGRVTLAAEKTEVPCPVGAEPDTKPGEYTVFLCGLSNPTTNDYILIAHLAPPLKVIVRP